MRMRTNNFPSSPKNNQAMSRLRSPEGRSTIKEDLAKVQAQVNRVIQEINPHEMMRKSVEK